MPEQIYQLTQQSHFIKNAWNFITEHFNIKEPRTKLATLLLTLNFDEETIATALIYENKILPTNKEEFAPYLHNPILQQLLKLQNLDKLTIINQQIINSYQNIDNLRKMFLVMATDVRLITLKIAEHLIRMEEADQNHADPTTLIKLAKEAEIIYNPLANRLGINKLKYELENLTFKFNDPVVYQNLKQQIDTLFPEPENQIKTIIDRLKQLLQPLETLKIVGRAKHLYSIHRKMMRKHTQVRGICDIIAFRILVNSVPDCYKVLSIIHDHWQYLPEEFDDYIATPKPNGYQSIHTAIVYDANGPQIIEIQIRTEQMHQYAELGLAAHWIYKENHKLDAYQLKLNWLHELMAWQKNIDVKLTTIFNDFIYVFTPKGDIIEMPFLATPLDFAYYIHESVGHHCIGAKVNNVIAPLTQLLKNGDKVEVVTSLHSFPKRDWLITSLGYIRTNRAKLKINHWFKKEALKANRLLGEQLYNKLLRKLKKEVDPHLWLHKFKLNSLQHLWENLGSGQITGQQLENMLLIEHPVPLDKPLILNVNAVTDSLKLAVTVKGVSNILINCAKCCHPKPQEPITGYITRSKGITIHRNDCKNLKRILHCHPEKLIEVVWQNPLKKVTKQKTASTT